MGESPGMPCRGGDFLLIYQIDDSPKPSGSINFVRAGTHAELFE